MSVERKLEQIRSSDLDNKGQVERYQGLAEELVSRGAVSDLHLLLAHLLDERGVQAISRPGLVSFAEVIKRLPEDSFEELANATVLAIKNKSGSYDEADFILREALFDHLIRQNQFSAAGQILSGLNLESSQQVYNDSQKVDIYIRCAEAFLEDGEGNEAEIFLNRASPLMHAVKEWSLQLRYSVTLARVLDSNRKFVDAALRYYDLSTTQNKQVVQDDLLELYGKAITCAILGKAGPQRVRTMGILYKDDRRDQLDKILPQYASHAAMLTKMYNNEIIRPDDMVAFQSSLMEHQKAVAADGFSLPQRAFIEHNLSAARRIYTNIYFSELAYLVGLDMKTTETVATKMILEGRLKGIIDQTEGLLYFTETEDDSVVWDESIKQTCSQLNEVVETIERLDLVR